ncbi:MAG TPA: response regulator [Woeseiaceae bacterium]|jgi:CheY-like chemotaxis protein|nr:response regulator [Woeseiaceae bacterium]
MNTTREYRNIRVLIADDDEMILECYRKAFGGNGEFEKGRLLDTLAAELFEPEDEVGAAPRFNVVSCSQGRDAIDLAATAAEEGRPFDVVILDVRMPPGIDGVEAGSRIRQMDPTVEIVFVTGYSDIPRDELERRVPPPTKLHYFNKPLSFLRLAEDVAGMVQTSS